MVFRIFVAAAILIACFFLYKVYGYRYVLDDIRATSSAGMIMGDENAPITILAYIDYGSSWSRRAHPILLQTLSRNPDVNIIIKPIPGLSENSELATRIALAALQDNRFLDIHNILMEAPRLSEDYIRKTVATRGLDYDVLLARAYDEPVNDLISEIKREALFLGVQTTPHIYLNDISLSEGTYDVNNMDKLIKDIKLGRL